MRPANILRYRRIAIDSNVFLSALDPRPEHNALARNFFGKAARSSATMLASTMVYVETLVHAYELGNESFIQDAIEVITGGGRVTMIPIDDVIALKSAELRGHFLRNKRKLTSPDAIHLATAILGEASIFVTNDRDFPEQTIEGVRIVRLSEK